MQRNWLVLLLVLASCAAQRGDQTLVSINLIDREGMSETINNEDRLKRYKDVDFLGPQPYQKVLRVYKCEQESRTPAYVTSYHPNGQLRQYLEVVNGRAFGSYREWFSNGVMKLEAHVIGGMADVTTEAEKSWLFEGCSRVFDDEGNLQAEIPYSKGELNGASIYYHPNGMMAKRIPFQRNKLEGTYEIFRNDGFLLQTAEYHEGLVSGGSLSYWDNGNIASQETFSKGKLVTGAYFDPEGLCLSRIEGGNGKRAVITKEGCELHEYRNGILNGEIQVVNKNGQLIRRYCVKDGLKNGDEIIYYEETALPKLSIHWSDSRIHGLVKTWYENGVPESQREMSRNVKNGLLTAWYKDGNLMLIEEYDSGKLMKGKYYRKGDKAPFSKVDGGVGIATLFDSEGNFLRKISYNHGLPSE